MTKNDYLAEASSLKMKQFLVYSKDEVENLIRCCRNCYDQTEKEEMWDVVSFIKKCIFYVGNDCATPAGVSDWELAKIQQLYNIKANEE